MKFIKGIIRDYYKSADLRRTGPLLKIDRYLIFFLLVVAALLYIPLLGNHHLFDPWENHYSQVAWETMQHGDWARLWYRNQNNFWSKPPMLFWMLMVFFRFGISEFTARLPMALLSLGVLSGFYIMLTRLFKRRVAFISSLILMTSPSYFMLSRHVVVDLPFVGFNTIAILCLTLYVTGKFRENDMISIPPGRFNISIPRRDFFLYMFYFSAGLAFLSKALLSIVLPGIILFMYMLVTGNFGIFFRWKHFKKHLLGFLIYLAVVMPWFGYMWYDAGKRFVDIFIVYHHFKRAAGVIHKPNDLYTMYIQVIGYSLFPWIMFFPAAMLSFFRGDRKIGEYRKHIFLFFAFTGPFFFYAFSSSKFYHYIAPVIPFAAIIIGHYLSSLMHTKWTWGRKAEIASALFILGAVGNDIGSKQGLLVHLVTFYQNRSLPYIPSYIWVTSITFGIAGLMFFISIYSKKIRSLAFPVLFVLTSGFMIYYFAMAMPEISRIYCLKPLTEKYLEISPDRDPIADYYKWFRRSTSFWLKNNITFLKREKEKKVLRFFKSPGRKYVILKNYDIKKFKRIVKRINKKANVIKKGPLNSLMEVVGPGEKLNLERASKYILDSPPEDMVNVNAVFDDVIELLGYTIKSGSETPREGETVSIELYFKALKSNIAKDYTVFLHNEGNKGDKRTKGDGAMADGAYPTTYWKKGDIVRHVTRARIPRNNKNDYYIPWVGIYQEDYRASISNPDEVPNDGDNRLELIKLQIKR